MKKNILLIGVGGTGSSAVDIFYQKKQELGNQTDNNITALVFDTDAGDLKKITAAKTVVMADNASVGTICDRFGKEFLKEWFPCDDKAVRSQEMMRGASQWRKKSYLAFLNLMNDQLKRNTFISALESMSADPSAICEVYVISSVAGGTGSGSFIPIALYAKRYLRKALGKDPIVNAMIALPDIYAGAQTPENKIKVYSNAYAILRELNAINLVSRNYNAGVSEHKKAPIRFRIGDPKEPNVGLLFDSMDKSFWSPEAAPFSQIFLLDRIPGLNSVPAHNMVLANSLYTILCTEIGSAFDSEFSNHELLRSQNNGSNAVYAGISTSQIRFPKEAVLNYLAHKKTLDACNAEWLILHNAVEQKIKEEEQLAKANNRKFDMAEGQYANMVIECLHDLEANNNDAILSLMERAVYMFDENNKRTSATVADGYAEKIEAFINSKIPAANKSDVNEYINMKTPRLGKNDGAKIRGYAQDAYEAILGYYSECIDVLKSGSRSTADSIISLDPKKSEFVNPNISAVEALLKKKDGAALQAGYVHPVAAMIRLCLFRQKLTEKLSSLNHVQEWEGLKLRTVDSIADESLLVLANAGKKNQRSWYSRQKDDRFVQIAGGDYDRQYSAAGTEKVKTDYALDFGYVRKDIEGIAKNITSKAQEQLQKMVYSSIAKSIDIIIEKYRSFFKRFDKEKEDLIELTKTAHRQDAGTVDSVINVFSSKEDKDYIYKTVIEEAGPGTSADVADTDNIVGQGVFATVYSSASAAFMGDGSYNDKDSGAYRSLFGSMVKAYRESIRKSEEFEKVASYSVVEAMVATCKGNKSEKAMSDAFADAFSNAQKFATPSLKLDAKLEGDVVNHSEIIVFMMSKNTGRYLKMHAEELGLSVPADQNNENNVIGVCAAEFIKRYSGNTGARVVIVESMPDQVLYCTGEIMDITPLRLAKCNELSEDPVYFKNYMLAIANARKYDTDMWNPHIGNNLHKRGSLPYMNELKERDCDIAAVKALLYAFQTKNVTYKSGLGDSKDKYYFHHINKKITDSEGRWINDKNIASLIAWIRNEDGLVEEWSAGFDTEILRQKNTLPSISIDGTTEVSVLEAALTKSAYMQLLNVELYKCGNRSISALEFAYLIKVSEELGRDCDDAERVLGVLYTTFKDMCEHRANIDVNQERFIKIYNQQIGKVFEYFALTDSIQGKGKETANSEDEKKSRLIAFVQWLNSNDTFYDIDNDNGIDDKGRVVIAHTPSLKDISFAKKESAETKVKEENTEN